MEVLGRGAMARRVVVSGTKSVVNAFLVLVLHILKDKLVGDVSHCCMPRL